MLYLEGKSRSETCLIRCMIFSDGDITRTIETVKSDVVTRHACVTRLEICRDIFLTFGFSPGYLRPMQL